MILRKVVISKELTRSGLVSRSVRLSFQNVVLVINHGNSRNVTKIADRDDESITIVGNNGLAHRAGVNVASSILVKDENRLTSRVLGSSEVREDEAKRTTSATFRPNNRLFDVRDVLIVAVTLVGDALSAKSGTASDTSQESKASNRLNEGASVCHVQLSIDATG